MPAIDFLNNSREWWGPSWEYPEAILIPGWLLGISEPAVVKSEDYLKGLSQKPGYDCWWVWDWIHSRRATSHITLDSGNVSLEKQLISAFPKTAWQHPDKVLVFLSNIYLRTIFLQTSKKLSCLKGWSTTPPCSWGFPQIRTAHHVTPSMSSFRTSQGRLQWKKRFHIEVFQAHL